MFILPGGYPSVCLVHKIGKCKKRWHIKYCLIVFFFCKSDNYGKNIIRSACSSMLRTHRECTDSRIDIGCLSSYLEIVISASPHDCWFQYKPSKCQLYLFVYRSCDSPNTVQVLVVFPIIIGIWRSEMAGGIGQKTTTSMLRSWQRKTKI